MLSDLVYIEPYTPGRETKTAITIIIGNRSHMSVSIAGCQMSGRTDLRLDCMATTEGGGGGGGVG